jgi:DNA polymerase-3 subunit gamma/tau
MRQLLETAQYAPTRGRFKVYVIDEVHQLSGHAFNSMLKTLEEPPEHVKFILATTDPQKIPVTVLSRCLQFNLKQMPPAAIAGHLAKVLAAEKIEYEPEALPVIARAAAGSMRDALSLLDQAIAHGGGRVAGAGVSEMLGTIDQSYLLRLIECVAAGDVAGAAAVADDMQARSLSFDGALADLGGLLLRIALAQAAPGALYDVAERARIENLASRLDPESVQLYYQIALQGREDLPLAPDEHAGFLMTVLRMLAFRPEGGIEKLPVAEKAAVAASRPPPAKAAEARATAAEPRATAAGGWPELAAQLQVAGAARELARNAELRSREQNIFDLVVPKAKAFLADRVHQDKLKAALEQHLGVAVTVKVSVGEVSGASAAAIEAGDRDARRTAAAQAVQSDGFVQDLVNMFDGKVVDSTIRSPEK